MIYGELASEKPLLIQDSAIKIDCADSRVIVADPAFYTFFGLRATFFFRQNIFPEDLPTFDAVFNNPDSVQIGQRIIVRLLDAEGLPNWACLEVMEIEREWESFIKFLVNDLNSFISKYGEIDDRSRSMHAILRQFDSVYFEYIPATDFWKIYKISEGADIIILEDTLENWNKKLIEENSISGDLAHLNNLCSFLRNGQDRFNCTLFSNMLSDDGAMENVVFRGSACYKNGSVVKVAGAIYVRRNRGDAIDLDNYDFLTGVLNRRAIINRYEELVSAKPDSDLTLCVIDVDYFKEINDNYGHAVGDSVLKQVAMIIRNTVADFGYVGRIGGDEFLVILPGIGSGAVLCGILTSICKGIRNIYLEKCSHRITSSIGSASYPVDAQTYDTLFKIADFALYLAKEKGRDRYIIFTPERHNDLYEAYVSNSKKPSNNFKDLRPIFMSKIYHAVYKDEQELDFEAMFKEICEYFDADGLMFYTGKDLRLTHSFESFVIKGKKMLQNFPLDESYSEKISTGVFPCGAVNELKLLLPKMFEALDSRGVVSFIQVAFDLNTDQAVLFNLQYCRNRRKFNSEDSEYVRLIFEMLTEYMRR